MITWIIIWLTLMALVLVVLIQRKWTSWESWFLVVFASMVIAVVVGPRAISMSEVWLVVWGVWLALVAFVVFLLPSRWRSWDTFLLIVLAVMMGVIVVAVYVTQSLMAEAPIGSFTQAI
jgi:hypothetical protein